LYFKWHFKICILSKRDLYFNRRKIKLIEDYAKCRHPKKLTSKGNLRQVFICLKPPPLLGFRLGWLSNFEGSESGQIYSVKLLQNMVFNGDRKARKVSLQVNFAMTSMSFIFLHFRIFVWQKQ
jgi:hypothetical protein